MCLGLFFGWFTGLYSVFIVSFLLLTCYPCVFYEHVIDCCWVFAGFFSSFRAFNCDSNDILEKPTPRAVAVATVGFFLSQVLAGNIKPQPRAVAIFILNTCQAMATEMLCRARWRQITNLGSRLKFGLLPNFFKIKHIIEFFVDYKKMTFIAEMYHILLYLCIYV